MLLLLADEEGRLEVATAAFGLAAVLLVVALLTPALPLATVFFFFAAVALGASNPPIDAARLDVVQFRFWGRAESVRSLRTTLQAAGPPSFGALSDFLGMRAVASGVIPRHTDGLLLAFLVMIAAILIAGLKAFLARRPYPADARRASAASTPPASLPAT